MLGGCGVVGLLALGHPVRTTMQESSAAIPIGRKADSAIAADA